MVDVLVAGTVSDSHTWNLIFLQLFCEERGLRVANLGPCVPDALLVAETVALRPGVVVLSSVNGHGYTDGLVTVQVLKAAVPDARVVIGGKLGIDGRGRGEWTSALVDAGFDAVFQGGDLEAFGDYLAGAPLAVGS
ncbi:cobalamin B12-binding domain-containing protein [Actinokineospora pegani]|uniref:cobalamin B12-binding domain-containing protein n=1 Tax=Actinokineospora pegani TaxID=2654637 RepID=UPI001F1BC25D|nr:cobalamin-dependent protein [Actinokineospora pegani]